MDKSLTFRTAMEQILEGNKNELQVNLQTQLEVLENSMCR